MHSKISCEASASDCKGLPLVASHDSLRRYIFLASYLSKLFKDHTLRNGPSTSLVKLTPSLMPMLLRSGLLLGQSEANQAVEEPAVTAMQEDNFSTGAEWGTPHPSSFSTNDNVTSPNSPVLGEAGPSNYQDAHQPIPRSLREEHRQEDFQLFDTPTPPNDPAQYDDDGLLEDHIPIPLAPQRSIASQHRFTPSHQERNSNYTYVEGVSGHATPTQPSLPPLRPVQGPGRIQEWTSGPKPWSPVDQNHPDTRKRSLFQDNPTQDLTGYPRDRNFRDKMETEIEEIQKGGPDVDSEEERRRRKKLRRSTRVSKGISSSRGYESSHKDHDQDREHDGQGSGQSMRAV